jgi:hypothetical protein
MKTILYIIIGIFLWWTAPVWVPTIVLGVGVAIMEFNAEHRHE